MRKLSAKQLDALEQCASVRRAELREFRANTIQSLIELSLINTEVTGCGADSDCAQHGDGTTIAADQPCSGTWLYFVTARGVAWLTSQRETAVVWDAPTKADQRVQSRYTGRIVTVTKIQPDNGVVYVSTDSDLGGHVNAFRVIDDSTPLEEIAEPVVTAEPEGVVKSISRTGRVAAVAVPGDWRMQTRPVRPGDTVDMRTPFGAVNVHVTAENQTALGFEQEETPVHDGPMAQQHRAEYHDSNGRCFLYGDACAVPGKGPTELAVWLKPGVVLTPSEYSGRVFRFVDWRPGGAYVRNVMTGHGQTVPQSEIVLWKHLPEQNADIDGMGARQANELRPEVGDVVVHKIGDAREFIVRTVHAIDEYVLLGDSNVWVAMNHLRVVRKGTPGPRFPKGTPEYTKYAKDLRVELQKYVAGEPPYAYPDPELSPHVERAFSLWSDAVREDEPTAPVPGSTDHVRVLTEQRDAAEQALNKLRERLSWLLGRHNYEPGIPLEYIREALEETR